ncbi:hypothetical protein HB364_24995 [Pseudoflavitalea sp. X16]|uniref:hypothetical protein n=1 Tax=Paraflavitalea devenefica TaxID=2716334 RepID=UPI0014233BD6|nr:hypothetical protein [Paraflavitalea devenefica]NII28364.1 hypothetical protein [Paraflavitalea devenefica]
MAKQVGPIFLECTWDDLTFYKMDGKYYARKKSRLTREKVLKHPRFAKTRHYATLLACASKIASSIYKDLPLHWRQFWMFRGFTGEALTMLHECFTAQDAYDYLWETYVEYWVLYQQKTGIQLRTGRKDKPFRRGKTYKTRLKHLTENSKCRRYLKILGKNHWKSSYDHTADRLQQERKRLARQAHLEWIEEQRLKGRWKEQEERWRIMQASNKLVA